MNGEMKYRLKCAADQGVPMTNYGIAIAHMKGIPETQHRHVSGGPGGAGTGNSRSSRRTGINASRYGAGTGINDSRRGTGTSINGGRRGPEQAFARTKGRAETSYENV